MQRLELGKELIDNFKYAVERENGSWLNETLALLHPADIAEVLDIVNMEQAAYIYGFVDKDIAPDVLLEIDEDTREKFLEDLSSKEIAEQLIDQIESDDAADVLGEMTEEKQEEIISLLEDEEQASDIVQLLTYDEDSAGGLMAKELVKVNANWTVSKGIREMRKQAGEIDQIYTIYVVDDKNKLIGRLSLKRLLFSSTSVKSTIENLYIKEELISVTPEVDNEEVAQIMKKYDLVVLPVVSTTGELLGRITIDDVVDVLQEEAEKDYQLASGISESVESDDSVWLLTRARFPWLLIGLLGGVLVAQVIGRFEGQLSKYTELALFIPLIAAMAGNVGVQSSAIVVQGLANQSIFTGTIFSRLTKEFFVAIVNGIILSLILFAITMFISRDGNGYALSYTVSISLFIVIIFAGLFGTFVPLVLDKVKIDPALATGPFITTMNDIFGLIIYFYISFLLY
ncbi:MAG: magnesium transporter [Flavobacteriales bacterium]|nr:magnesium transporter [Flavobacteriales bacterium]